MAQFLEFAQIGHYSAVGFQRGTVAGSSAVSASLGAAEEQTSN
jgi:hypothetical protein